MSNNKTLSEPIKHRVSEDGQATVDNVSLLSVSGLELVRFLYNAACDNKGSLFFNTDCYYWAALLLYV